MGISFVIFYIALVLGFCALVLLGAKKLVLAFHVLQMRAHEAAQREQAERLKMHSWQTGFEQKLKTERANLQEVIKALEEKVKNRSVDLEKAIAQLQVIKAQLHARELEITELKSKLSLKKKTKKRA